MGKKEKVVDVDEKERGCGQKRKGGQTKSKLEWKVQLRLDVALPHSCTDHPTTEAIKYIFQLRQIHLQLQFRQIYL